MIIFRHMVYKNKNSRIALEVKFSFALIRCHFITILAIAFFGFPTGLDAQTPEGFQMEFDKLIMDFVHLAGNERSLSVFESEKEVIGQRASRIKDDIRDHLKNIEYNQRSSYHELIDKIECFDSFTKYHGINECPCLSAFNVLLNRMSANVGRSWDKDNMVMEYAVIGNYKFHYLYNKEDVIYRLSINSINGKGGKSSFEVGSWGGIDIFDITDAREDFKLVNVQYKQFPQPNPMKKMDGCRDLFPRR